jgi:hypothetical protein
MQKITDSRQSCSQRLARKIPPQAFGGSDHLEKVVTLIRRHKVAHHLLLVGDALRFAIAGILNTSLTLLAYQLFLFVMPRQGVYALSWVCGIVFVLVFYPSQVFTGGRTSWMARICLGLSYGVIFLLGLAILELLNSTDISPRISIFLVTAVTTLASFLVGRFLLRR